VNGNSSPRVRPPPEALSLSVREERDLFIAFAFAAADLFLRVDPEGQVSYCIGAAQRIFGCDANTLIGRRLFSLISDVDRRLLQLALAKLSPGGRLGLLDIRVLKASSGDVQTGISGWRDNASGMLHLAVSVLTHGNAGRALDNRDRRTGLYALADFQGLAADRMRIVRTLGDEARLTLLELKGLDAVTRSLGPAAADALVGDIGAALRQHSIGGNSAGQLGPDRLGLIHSTHVDAEEIVDGITNAALNSSADAQKLEISHRTVVLDAANVSETDEGRAISFAIRLFADRGAHEFSVGSAEDSLKLMLADTVGRIARLRQTLAGKSFRVVYQPIVTLRDRELHHWEALTRFPEGGSPFETIRFAEGTDLIEELDLSVIASVLAHLQANCDLPRHRVAVNLSARTIASDLFVTALDEVLARFADVRAQLLFEVTESSQIADLGKAAKILKHLRDAGHAVCLDDFGAGSSSFPYLQALPLDFVKIDGSYVSEVVSDSRQQAIARGMVRLCEDMGIGTIAEMIECEDQATLLETMGVGYGQGWLFGKPIDTLRAATSVAV
jgi:EAL domain-containing protein (putative c-di-GMP-specific phosphodiesterase class I)/PAS domain-containing protein